MAMSDKGELIAEERLADCENYPMPTLLVQTRPCSVMCQLKAGDAIIATAINTLSMYNGCYDSLLSSTVNLVMRYCPEDVNARDIDFIFRRS